MGDELKSFLCWVMISLLNAENQMRGNACDEGSSVRIFFWSTDLVYMPILVVRLVMLLYVILT